MTSSKVISEAVSDSYPLDCLLFWTDVIDCGRLVLEWTETTECTDGVRCALGLARFGIHISSQKDIIRGKDRTSWILSSGESTK